VPEHGGGQVDLHVPRWPDGAEIVDCLGDLAIKLPRGFYALGVGLCFATLSRHRARLGCLPARFYALGVGLCFATKFQRKS
jgi:hypothetical protein